MNALFVVTGKAGKSGHEQWRKVNEEDFSTRIYTHSKREASEASRLEIELRNFRGNIYSYYTYLRVKNVAQIKSKEDEEKGERHGRTGSFFGMTIRVKDGYIRNISKLYSLFETVFESRIKGIILTDENTDGYLTYLIEKLADGEDSFILAEKDLLSAITTDDILKLPENLVPQQQRKGEMKTKLFNVEDTTHSSFLPTLFNDAEINVSREYYTFAEIEDRRKQAEKLRKEQEESERKKRESKVNLIQSSNNPPTHTTKEKDNVMSSSNVEIGESPSRHQTINATNDADSSLSENSIKPNVAFIKLLLKIISTIQKTNEILLSFAVQQLRESETKQECNSEYKEYEEKLSIINNEIEASKDDLNKLLEKYFYNKDVSKDSVSSNWNHKNYDYKLLIPIVVVLLIIVGGFFWPSNPDNDSNKGLVNIVDTAIVAAVAPLDSTNSNNKDTLLSEVFPKKTKYKVKTSANMREIPTNGTVVNTLSQDAYFYVIKDTLAGTWVYGETDDGKLGYIKKNLLELVH